MKVLKFGGSSIGNPDRIRKVKDIVSQQKRPSVIVVSAFEGITDQLLKISRMAMAHDDSYTDELCTVIEFHKDILNQLNISSQSGNITEKVDGLLNELSDILKGVFFLHELTPKILDHILSIGELLSSSIISALIEDSLYFDSRLLIKTDSGFGNARANFAITNDLINKSLKGLKYNAIVPGFIASDANGETTTLGRGGSDYTAAIIAAALNAEVLEIWTDVDGFMTADPRKVSKAVPIEKMSYAEAIELSHFGAKVVYTPTIQPVYQKGIPILIKNSFNPSAKGTLISSTTDTSHDALIKGISSIDEVTLVTLQGPGMVGVPGISMRLFGAIAKARVNVLFITQASSEYNITFAIMPEDTERAINSIKEEFNVEINNKNEIRIQAEKNLSLIAIVGEKMKNTPGISATLFRALARNGINVISTAQGSSELNISVAINKESLSKALNSIHEGFFLSQYKELNLFLVGTGNIGGALLEQINKQQKKLLKNQRLKINVVGIINEFFMVFKENGIDAGNYMTIMQSEGGVPDLNLFVSKMKQLNLRNSVFIDCTASPEVASKYPEILGSFSSVVTANKIACSSEYSHYVALKEAAYSKGVKFKYETNVGAGLPVINTINDLINSGDKILKIEAVLSGTLNFIFNTISADIPLSRTVELAKEKGYSEPDPRIDLSGTDVIRKLLILARESGYPLEKTDVQVNTFLPAECFEGDLDHFWKSVKKYDVDFENRRKILEKENKRWRFVAILDNGKASIQLVEVDVNHPAYVLEGSNNIIILTTERYKELPMVIKGYGAGAGVTAAGVFADILRVANV
jgi:bifunctional aspartokinase / homoserine dehydrogenase 1